MSDDERLGARETWTNRLRHIDDLRALAQSHVSFAEHACDQLGSEPRYHPAKAAAAVVEMHLALADTYRDEAVRLEGEMLAEAETYRRRLMGSTSDWVRPRSDVPTKADLQERIDRVLTEADTGRQNLPAAWVANTLRGRTR